MTFQALVGWAFVAVTLTVFADIDSTAEIATAFAWLILIAVLFESGPQVFDTLAGLIGGNVQSQGNIKK